MEQPSNQRHFEPGNYFQFSRKVRKEFEEWASVGDKFRLLQFNSSSLSLQKMLLILQPFVFVFVKVTTIRSRWIWKILSRPLVRLRNDKDGEIFHCLLPLFSRQTKQSFFVTFEQKSVSRWRIIEPKKKLLKMINIYFASINETCLSH